MSKDLFGAMGVSAAGLSAQRMRMEAIAKNIANAQTTRSGEDGQAYRRRRVVINASEETRVARKRTASHKLRLSCTSSMHINGGSGSTRRSREATEPALDAQEMIDPNSAFTMVFDPSHPDAGPDGYVQMPDINTVTEMVDMMTATRAYEANLSAMKAYQNIVTKSLDI